MEQNSSKIVSLHMKECGLQCPHSSVCYHNAKVNTENIFIFGLKDRINILRKGWTIHESLCGKLEKINWYLLKNYKNYNITIPCTFYEPYFDRVKDQIQLTIYNEYYAEIYKEYQKIYLVKDDKTYEFFVSHLDNGFGTQKIHYVFDQNFLTKEKLLNVISLFQQSHNKTISLDSCLSSFIVNGKCPYESGKYIDITYDGTIRSCPFKKEGILLPFKYFSTDEDYENLFNLENNNCCKYKEYFKRKNE